MKRYMYIGLAVLLTAVVCASEMVPFVIPAETSPDSEIAFESQPLTEKDRLAAGEHFRSAEGKRVRLWGVNLSFGANFPTHNDAALIAKRMSAFGVNSVRFHHMDTANWPRGIWDANGKDLHPDGQVTPPSGDNAGSALERMQQSLQRSRRHARGLVQPWIRGERWGIDARSIQRELSQKEVEDFLAQPDLWKKLLEPVRELESTLRAEATSAQLKKKLFSAPEETVPAPYRDLVGEYYRELSRVDRENSRP